jgi:hypothetical protein
MCVAAFNDIHIFKVVDIVVVGIFVAAVAEASLSHPTSYTMF